MAAPFARSLFELIFIRLDTEQLLVDAVFFCHLFSPFLRPMPPRYIKEARFLRPHWCAFLRWLF